MRWLKRDRWKAGITIAGMLLLLVLMVWVPVSAARADEGAWGLATPGTGTVQVTPTEDATVTALNKEKLAQEVQQLKNQNDSDLLGWLRTNASLLLSTLVVVIGGLIGLFRWLGDRRDEQEKRRQDQQSERERRAEERFQTAVVGLGDEKEGTRIGAAILLRTFLRPSYEQFYIQVFDLAVANLRLPTTSNPPEDLNTPLPLTTLRQALIVVFKEAFPLARDQEKRSPQSLNASRIQLDNAYLRGSDMKQVWMRQASLRGADLSEVNLSVANLFHTNFSGANLSGATLSVADLFQANLSGANLFQATLIGANLYQANLTKANLTEANLTEADLSRAILEEALSLKDTDLRGVKGLTKEQLEVCKAKGAIIDEDSTPSPPQAPASPPASAESTDAQASSSPSAQGRTPPSETAGSRTTSSKPSEEGQAQVAPAGQERTPSPGTDRSNAASSPDQLHQQRRCGSGEKPQMSRGTWLPGEDSNLHHAS